MKLSWLNGDYLAWGCASEMLFEKGVNLFCIKVLVLIFN